MFLGILDSPENKYVQGHRAFTPWNRRPTAYQASVEYSKETVENDLQINTANDDEPPNEDSPNKYHHYPTDYAEDYLHLDNALDIYNDFAHRDTH